MGISFTNKQVERYFGFDFLLFCRKMLIFTFRIKLLCLFFMVVMVSFVTSYRSAGFLFNLDLRQPPPSDLPLNLSC
jgi:hypothetical protein